MKNIAEGQSAMKIDSSKSAKTLPVPENIIKFDSMVRKFTIPEIKRGTKVTDIPKGSTKKPSRPRKHGTSN
jgi:hypothetical protein